MIRNPRGRPDAGFSLLEVLVAFTILAIMLGVVFQIFGRGARTMPVADSYVRATLIAESVLAGAGAEYEIVPGRTTTRHKGGFIAVTTISDLPSASGRSEISDAAKGLVVREIDVEVRWTDSSDRSVTLTTVRLVPASPSTTPSR